MKKILHILIVALFSLGFVSCGVFENTVKKAEDGEVEAQYTLGVKYEDGEDVPQDYQRAAHWYTKAAEQGHVEAQFKIGMLYVKARGVPRDYKQAAYWWAKAAELGHASAQFNLGVMYYKGQGVTQNYKLAYVWCKMAAEQGYPSAIKNKDIAARKLTPQQFSEAQDQAAKLTRINKFAHQSFENYRVPIYKGKIHLPKWISKDGDDDWRDDLGKSVSEPKINFAGKYFIESHSCGTMCSYYTLTDLSTGQDLDLLQRFNNGENRIVNQEEIYNYHTDLFTEPDSNILVARKCALSWEGEVLNCEESVFLFKGERLKLISAHANLADHSDGNPKRVNPASTSSPKHEPKIRKAEESKKKIVKETELSPRQIEIIQTILNPDGYISKELHSEFWGLMPVEVRENEQGRNFIADFIEKNFVYGINFSREGWASMKASIEAGRVIKTPGYESAKIKFKTSAPQQARQKIQESIDNAEEMIKASAYRKPFQTDRGTIYITPEMVDQVIAGFDASSSRVRRLMNLEWEKKIKEYLCPEAHVAILSDSPFAVEKKRLVAQNQKKIETVTLTNQTDENTIIVITFSHYDSVFRDPEGAVKRNVKSIITASGASVSSLYSSQWRNLQSANGDGEWKTSDEAFFFSVRSVELRDQKGILSLMVASSVSKIEANLSLKRLEQSLQIIK